MAHYTKMRTGGITPTNTPDPQHRTVLNCPSTIMCLEEMARLQCAAGRMRSLKEPLVTAVSVPVVEETTISGVETTNWAKIGIVGPRPIRLNA